MTIIQHDVWPYHRFPLSYRDVQELPYQRGIQVSDETLREWRSSSALTSLRNCATGNLVGVPGGIWTSVDGVRHWLFLGRTDARLGQSSAVDHA